MKKGLLRGFVFYTQDYFGDIAVRLMPVDLRMIWVEAFFLMDQSPRRGVLLQKNKEPYSVTELATIMNTTPGLVEKTLAYVVEKGIADIDRSTRAIMSRRMVRERKRSEINAKNGRKGGNPHLVIHSNIKPEMQSVNRNTNRSDKAKPDPEPDLSLTPPVPPKGAAFQYPADFEKFWAAYPKKTGKGDALKSWKKNNHPSAEKLIAILERAKTCRDWLEQNGRFIPKPSTWLNQKRWDDDYGPITPKKREVVY